MSLYSGKRIHSYEWKEIPIDEEVIQQVEELAMEEEATEMKRGYPVFTWKRRFLDDPELNVNDADGDNRSEILPGDNLDDDINNEVEEDNDDEEQIEQHLIAPNNENDDFEGLVDNEEEENIGDNNKGTNYITDESSVNENTNDDDNNGNELDDEKLMSDITDNMDTIHEETEEIDNDDDNMNEDEGKGIEVELNASGRPKRKCAGAGIERLEMSLDNNKKYASVKGKRYQLTMESKKHPLIRRGQSFMGVAANYLFAQVTEHTQMSAKAGIKKFGDRAVTAMLSEYN